MRSTTFGVVGSTSIVAAGFLLVLNTPAQTQDPASNPPSSRDATGSVAHGRYLVHDVAHCVACHTPRDESGKLIESKLLQGAVIPVRGPEGGATWAYESASIAGLKSYSRSEVTYLLTRGEMPDGHRPGPPMPEFHLATDDARAVVDYLESISTE